MVDIVLIAALSSNHVIGMDNDIPWRIPEDLQHFKATTLNHNLILGSNTWRSFGSKALPNRRHIILSRTPQNIEVSFKDAPMVCLTTSLDIAINVAKNRAEEDLQEEIFIIGGADIYQQAIGLADRMILTHVEGVFEGDRFFPPLTGWKGSPREINGSVMQVSDKQRYSIWDYSRA